MFAHYHAVLVVVLAAACATNVNGQNIEEQVRQTRNGTLTLVFASKPGVCGDGESYISTDADEEGRRSSFTRTRTGFNTNTGSTDYHYRDCDEGPVRVELQVTNGEVIAVQTKVGGALIPAHNVSARAAVDYLLSLAESATSPSAGKHAILPALLADSVDPSPRLLQIGANQRATREVRKSAIFWLGQAAGPAAVPGLRKFIQDDDGEIGKSAAFALSQIRNDESVRVLIDAARSSELSNDVRKSAIFWLGQAAGEKATAGLKDLLTDEDSEVKKQAVFALAQMKSAQSVDALIEAVKTSKDREVRKSALFWLGQSKDPRVLALFEDILLKQ
ncbi:MAG: HEAT repeat domain-containing protein [Gemmatimonadota bacterium]